MIQQEEETLQHMKDALDGEDVALHEDAVSLKYETLLDAAAPKIPRGRATPELRKEHIRLSAEVAVKVLLPSDIKLRAKNLAAILTRALLQPGVALPFILYRVPLGVLATLIASPDSPQWQRDVVWEWAASEQVGDQVVSLTVRGIDFDEVGREVRMANLERVFVTITKWRVRTHRATVFEADNWARQYFVLLALGTEAPPKHPLWLPPRDERYNPYKV
jgi:hypothetical protein